MTCPRVIGSSLVLAWLVACAHVGTRITDRSDAFWIGDIRIVLRYTAQDAGDAAEVQRALRAAVAVAEGWGPLPETLTVTIHPTHEALEAAWE